MKKALIPWIIGILVATLFMGALAVFIPFRYAASDDAPILRSFMGYEGGAPATFNLYLHTALAWLLHGLAVVFPGVAWFSLLQLFLLWFSCVVIVKCFCQCAANRGIPFWMGLIISGCFLLICPIFIVCRISYTTTAALVGAAAVAQLTSMNARTATDVQIIRSMLLSIGLLLTCYCIRQVGVLPPLAFWLINLGVIWRVSFKSIRSPKPLIIGALVCALSFGLFAGVRAVELKTRGLDDFMEWQQARIELFDYTEFGDNTDDAALDALGWSRSKFNLVSSWYFMDEDITADSFRALLAAQPESEPVPLWARLTGSLSTLHRFFVASPIFVSSCSLVLVLCLGNLLLALRRRGSRAGWLFLASLAGYGLMLVLMFYLAWEGRMPMRAAVSIVFPAVVFQCGLFFRCVACQPDSNEAYHWLNPISRITITLCLLLATIGSIQHMVDLHPPANPEMEARAMTPQDLDAFALSDPDMLIICDLSLSTDTRLFPDTTCGIPGNVMFWGGWQARTPSWQYQLAQYGIDGTAFTGKDFLRENVLVAGTDGQPWESLTTHIGESAGTEVDWDFYDESGYIGFYQYYEM